MQDPDFITQFKPLLDKYNKDHPADKPITTWALPILPHASGDAHILMQQPCLGNDPKAKGIENVFQTISFNGDNSGKMFFFFRRALPKLVAVWVPPGLTLPPAGPVSFHTFLHPDTISTYYPFDNKGKNPWSYPPYDGTATKDYPPAGNWIYPFRFSYAHYYLGSYMQDGTALVPSHQKTGKKTVLVFPVGYASGQWGPDFLSFDFQHRLLQEISFLLQRAGTSAPVSYENLVTTVGPSAISGYSAGGRFIDAVFHTSPLTPQVSPKTGKVVAPTQRAQTYYDNVLKEVYLFDGVIGGSGHSKTSGFQDRLLKWFRSGADKRIIRAYSQSGDWKLLEPAVTPSPTVEKKLLDGSEKHGPMGSIVYVPLTIWGNALKPPVGYFDAHPQFPTHWPYHAILNGNLP
jgi:hypothetical protein